MPPDKINFDLMLAFLSYKLIEIVNIYFRCKENTSDYIKNKTELDS